MTWDLGEAIAFYRKLGAPGDQNALISLLKEIQQENSNQIPLDILTAVADSYGLKHSFLAALIRRIPSLRLADTHTLEICCGPNCSKRAALLDWIEKNYGTKPAGFSIKSAPCMRMCGKGPNIRWDGVLYHSADTNLLKNLIDKNTP